MNNERNTEDYGGSDNQDNQDNQGGNNEGQSGQFGEFGDTGVGTDLTVEMENTDVRTGLVKGGEAGADDAAGPGQYGGDAGSISK
jgi:hypothetical protein